MDLSVHVLGGTPDSVIGRAGYTNLRRADQALRLVPQVRDEKIATRFPSLVAFPRLAYRMTSCRDSVHNTSEPHAAAVTAAQPLRQPLQTSSQLRQLRLSECPP